MWKEFSVVKMSQKDEVSQYFEYLEVSQYSEYSEVNQYFEYFEE